MAACSADMFWVDDNANILAYLLNVAVRGAAWAGQHSLRTIAFALVAICAMGTPAGAAGLSLGSITGLNFGFTYVGQQNTARVVVATNLDAAPAPISISILNLGLGLPGAQFVETNNCGTSLAAGASCSVWVNYTPTRVGNAQAILLFGDFNNNPTVYLVGTASAADTSGIFVDVDSPAGGGAVAGKMSASGWALANHDTIAGVWYSLDDPSSIFSSASYGSVRTDPCQAHPGVTGCPNVGWAFDVDTTVLSNGPHTLYIKVTTQQAGVIKVVSTPFTVGNRVTGPTSMLQVDWPAPGATLAGSVNLHGWAIGSFGLPIFDVRILVDGVEKADVPTSQARPDVCAVYPVRPSCPNVGWSSLLDTTWLADGPHTLTFLTPGLSLNLAATVPVTVANFAGSRSNPIRLVIDSPNAKTGNLGGRVTVTGWALADDDFVDQVSVFVDGAYFGEAVQGISRLDVCIAYPRRPGCPNVGWSYALDTGKLADGTHQLEMTARSSGRNATVQSQFTVSNASNPFHAYVDYPAAGETLSGTPTLSGWALNDNARVDSVAISVDGVPDGPAYTVLSRPDVCAVYPGRLNCPNVGWRYPLNTLKFTDGTHTLDVTVISGLQHATFGSSFTTANYPAANSTLLYIDRPNDASGTLSGTVTISGWAIDDRSPLYEAVSIAVDGSTLGGPVSYGLPRQDVCDVYPGGLACPNVGWSFLFDTASLTDGPHTVTVTVSGAKRKSASVKINVANGNTAAPSYRVYIDQPAANGPALRGNTRVSGWAIVTSGFQPSIIVYVDDIQAAAFPVFEPRADVCAVFPAAQNCPYVGWSVNVDTTPFADGAHTLKVVANSPVFGTGFVTMPITTNNSTGVDPMHLAIDSSASGNLSGVANLWGWAVSDDASISSVSVAVDGAALGNASYGDSRNDVCNIYQNRLGCPNVGWHLAVDTTKLSNGSHSVSVMATSSLGEQATQTATVTIKN